MLKCWRGVRKDAMPNQFVVLPCQDKKCGIETTLPQQILQDVIQHQRRSSTDSGFVNFVCPNCGLGAVHRASDLKPIQAVSVRTLVRPPIWRAFLRCVDPSCEVRVTVHTTAQIGDEPYSLTTASRNWKVDALECADGHRAKQPIELLGHHVFAGK